MDSLPYAFPSDAFDNGLASMPWFELMDELEEIVCAKEWNQAKDVMSLQNALYEQIGAKALFDEMEEEAAQEPEPDSAAPPRIGGGREPGPGGLSR